MHKREVKVFHVTDFLRQSIGKSRKKKWLQGHGSDYIKTCYVFTFKTYFQRTFF